MNKLSNTYIDSLIKMNVTKKELAFILYVSNFQDMYGIVHSVYYKDVCSNIRISFQSFYDILLSLSRKNLISYNKNNNIDFNVCLIGNVFIEKNFSSGYINVSKKDFNSERFTSLKAGSQLLYLYSQRFLEGKHMLLQNFYSDFCKLFGVKRKTLQLYIHELKKASLLFISKKRNKAYNFEMTMKRSTCLDIKGITPAERKGYLSNILNLITNSFKKYIDLNKKEDIAAINDIVRLADIRKGDEIKDFSEKLLVAIQESLDLQKSEKKDKLTLNAALVNRYLTQQFI